MRSDQSSRCFRVGHCQVKLTGIDNKRNENNFTQSKGANEIMPDERLTHRYVICIIQI